MTILIFMVRTRTFDPSTALSQAVALFSSKGYSETSMEDIVQATGVSRYGLYGTFGTGPGQVQYPWGIDGSGQRIFVLDSGNNRVHLLRKL